MTETIRYGLIGKEDFKVGTGTFETRLADGRIVTLSEVNVVDFMNQVMSGTNPLDDIITKGPWIDVRAYGASTSASAADNTTAITNAANDANSNGFGIILIPDGTFLVNGTLPLYSNVHYFGFGKNSLLKAASGSAFNIFEKTSGTLDNVKIIGIGFDGSNNYPVNSQVYKNGGTITANKAIYISITSTNMIIQNCYFNQLSSGSIDINAFDLENIQILYNGFFEASYIRSAIEIRLPSGTYTDAQRADRIKIIGNYIKKCGPQIHYDASKEDYVASSDGITIDSARDSIIALNDVHYAGSTGIRCEESLRIKIIGNTVTEAGTTGISCYKNTYDCSVIGNTVLNWGRTPFAYGIRNYSGTYVVAREFPNSSDAPLPADPTASSWFDTWPYSLGNIAIGTIITYGSSDYYTGTSSGILPFRGYAGIAVTQLSERITVIGNVTEHTTATDSSGDFTHANDYGFTPVHPSNDDTATSGNDCFIMGNDFRGRVYSIYHPVYHDNINQNGLLGTATYSGRRVDDAIINSNRPLFMVKPASAQNNIATGSDITVVWGTETKDQGGNFASNTFTAPMTGQYRLAYNMDLRNIDSAATLYEIKVITSNRTYVWIIDPQQFAGDLTHLTINNVYSADMDEGDTAYVVVHQSGGTAQTDIETNSWFSGCIEDGY